MAVESRPTTNPFTAVVPIVRRTDAAFLGTAFGFVEPSAFLAAAHCLKDLEPNDIGLSKPHLLPASMPVTQIYRHPTADLALLRTTDPLAIPFWSAVSNWAPGESFNCYGFREAIVGVAVAPTLEGKIATGIYQDIRNTSHQGYTFLAGELSMQSTPGLSGSPLFRPMAPSVVTGMVVGNIRSQQTLEQTEDVDVDGVKTITKIVQVQHVGIAVMLAAESDWLRYYLGRESVVGVP